MADPLGPRIVVEGNHCLKENGLVRWLRRRPGCWLQRPQHSHLGDVDAAARLIHAAVAMLAAKHLSLDWNLGKRCGR